MLIRQLSSPIITFKLFSKHFVNFPFNLYMFSDGGAMVVSKYYYKIYEFRIMFVGKYYFNLQDIISNILINI